MKVIATKPPMVTQPTVTIEFTLGEAYHLCMEMGRQAEISKNYGLVNSFFELERWVNEFNKEQKDKAFWEWRG